MEFPNNSHRTTGSIQQLLTQPPNPPNELLDPILDAIAFEEGDLIYGEEDLLRHAHGPAVDGIGAQFFVPDLPDVALLWNMGITLDEYDRFVHQAIAEAAVDGVGVEHFVPDASLGPFDDDTYFGQGNGEAGDAVTRDSYVPYPLPFFSPAASGSTSPSDQSIATPTYMTSSSGMQSWGFSESFMDQWSTQPLHLQVAESFAPFSNALIHSEALVAPSHLLMSSHPPERAAISTSEEDFYYGEAPAVQRPAASRPIVSTSNRPNNLQSVDSGSTTPPVQPVESSEPSAITWTAPLTGLYKKKPRRPNRNQGKKRAT